jgi:hypothetical protein
LIKKTPKELLRELSEREIEVLQLYCQHKTQKEIGKKLDITINTVKTHVSNICEKLEIETSDAGERKLIIFNTYFPLLSEDRLDENPPLKQAEIKEPPPAYVVEENDSKTEEVESETQDDELIPEDQLSENGGNKEMGTKKKRGCARFIITLILGALMVIGAWYSWENYLKDMPIVQSIVQLINPDAVIENSSSAPSSSSSSSSSSSNSSSSDSESIIEKILPKTDPYADAFDVGDWVKQDNVWVRLSDYEVTGTKVAVNIEVWNKTGREYFFSWNAEDNFSMVDNKNNKYDVAGGYLRKVNIDIDQRMRIPGHSIGTVDFDNDSIYNSGVTDLYVDMEYFATIDEAVFHIDLNN